MRLTNIVSFVFLLLSIFIFMLTPSFPKMMSDFGFWNMRDQLLYLTGIIAVMLMMVSMILSLRLQFINKLTGGLDKGYIVHKWVGIYAIVMSIIHWIFKEGDDWLINLGLIEKAAKGAKPPYTELESYLYHLGNNIVEYAFYIITAVIVISLIKKVPYNIFRYIHKTIPVLFLMIVFHAVTIQIRGQWFGSIGSYILNIILFFGAVIAIIDLFQLIGKSNKHKSVISNIKYDADNKILDITLKTINNKFEYKAGQYVFLKFSHSSEPHPFSIASYNKDSNEVRFLIKELGDYTSNLNKNIKTGDEVIIEGAYGNFTFEDNKDNQIWIAAGIGITPFMSRLDYLMTNKNTKNIDFYFTSRGISPYKDILEEKCKKTGINFHYINTATDGRLNMQLLENKSKDLNNSSIWYCGPVGFSKYLLKSLNNKKFTLNTFHFDNFDMR